MPLHMYEYMYSTACGPVPPPPALWDGRYVQCFWPEHNLFRMTLVSRPWPLNVLVLYNRFAPSRCRCQSNTSPGMTPPRPDRIGSPHAAGVRRFSASIVPSPGETECQGVLKSCQHEARCAAGWPLPDRASTDEVNTTTTSHVRFEGTTSEASSREKTTTGVTSGSSRLPPIYALFVWSPCAAKKVWRAEPLGMNTHKYQHDIVQ
jgi:hypothetical protein